MNEYIYNTDGDIEEIIIHDTESQSQAELMKASLLSVLNQISIDINRRSYD